MRHTDVTVIGGGAIGASVFRDATMRGFQTVLIEGNSIGGRTTMASHQNLLGGMRYVVKDPAVAEECASENRILAHVAPSIISGRKNLFVGDDDEYAESAMNAAKNIGVWYSEITPEEAFREIPELSRDLTTFLETEDRNIDARRLCQLNVEAAVGLGGLAREHSRVSSIALETDAFVVRCNTDIVRSRIVVNASGPWINEVAGMIGRSMSVAYQQGTICVMSAKSPRGIQYLRYPGNGDAYITHGSFAWLGTTSSPINHPSDARVLDNDLEYLRTQFGPVLPSVIRDRPIDAFVGVRTFPVKSGLGTDADGRKLSRDISIIESYPGFLSIAGGKLTTARLAAERIVDIAAKRLGSSKKCQTATKMLTR